MSYDKPCIENGDADLYDDRELVLGPSSAWGSREDAMSLLSLVALAADRVADLLGPPPPVATCEEPGAGWLAALEVLADERGAA